MHIVKVPSEAAVIATLSQHIETAASAAIAANGVFRIGLSGGSLIKYMAKLAADGLATDWSKWKLFFCDERFVAETDEDSTYGQYKKLFVPKTQLDISQFVVIDDKLELSDCAHAYERAIYEEFGIQDVSIIIEQKKTFIYFFFFLSWTSKQFQNSIYCFLEWDRTVTPVRCSPDINC